MVDNNLSKNILKNPHYLDLRDSGNLKRKKTLHTLPSIILILLSMLPLFILYAISVGFIIGGFNYVFSNIFYLSHIKTKVFLYNLIIGVLGLVLTVFAMYLTSFLIRLIRR